MIELMTVVAIIAISAAIAAPTLSAAMAQRRANEAVFSVVRVGAEARAQAMSYGRAHLLIFQEASGGASGNLGRVEVWRGTVNRCSANNWAAIVAGACETNPDCIDVVDMDRWTTMTHEVEMRVDGANAVQLCYQSNGEMLVATAGVFAPVPPAGTEAVRVRFQRQRGGAAEGPERAVLFPIGAAPRRER